MKIGRSEAEDIINYAGCNFPWESRYLISLGDVIMMKSMCSNIFFSLFLGKDDSPSIVKMGTEILADVLTLMGMRNCLDRKDSDHLNLVSYMTKAESNLSSTASIPNSFPTRKSSDQLSLSC